MGKLWKKDGQKMHPAVEKYTAGTDYLFDKELLPFDIIASRAHAKGLQKIGILTTSELRKITQCLNDLESDFKKGRVTIQPEDEDCHTVIENYLIKKVGQAGKKIHTGRSRNDQVLVATRLYMKSHLKIVHGKALELAGAFLGYAEKYIDVPMPGYTHTQQAMLSSVGHYMSSFAEALVDDSALIRTVLSHIDKNPLGSAAGFGTSFPIDRVFTAKELGFAQVQVNSLYCQNSRGKFESAYMEALAQIMMTLGKFAHDMLLFTSQEFCFFTVEDSLVTGSSIMPQKKNLDVLEIMRGNLSVVTANQLMIKDISKNLLSGYNRDLQLMKKPLMESTKILVESLEVADIVLHGLSPDAKMMRSKIHPAIFAADIANELVQKERMTFRDAYRKAMELLPQYGNSLEKNLKSKISLGAPGNLGLKAVHARVKRESKS